MCHITADDPYARHPVDVVLVVVHFTVVGVR
jgi:hypothetical protein